jgi:hypothetical protein
MWRDAFRTFALVGRRVLFGAAFLLGMALTPGAAWFGWQLGGRLLRGGCCSCHPRATPRLRVKAVRDAVTEYMIETPSCPRGIKELVAGNYLDESLATDPWGSALILKCPGLNDSDGADVTSAGPDRMFGTADDINSWEL